MTDRMTAAELRAKWGITDEAISKYDAAYRKGKKAAPEFQLNLATVQFLDLFLPRDAIYHHSPNELDMAGQDAARQIAKARKMGTRKGWPDLEIIWRGRIYFIELKAGDNDLSQDQKDTRDALILAGSTVAVCRTVTHVEEALKTWGMI